MVKRKKKSTRLATHGFGLKNLDAELHRAEASLGDGVTLDMVKLPGGQFQMGSPEGEGIYDERPQHLVTVGSFWMGKYPITQAQWKVVAGFARVERDLSPELSKFKGYDRPVEQVTWEEAVEFCQRLSQKAGCEFRLPSEAEWEYACRAGTKTRFYFGEKLTPKLAQCKSNEGMALLTFFRGQTAPVGSFPANNFGLYDMHGNVYEWCLDHWHENYDGAPTDGNAWTKGGEPDRRALRGGSFQFFPDVCRSANRTRGTHGNRYSYVGFRVVCTSSWTL